MSTSSNGGTNLIAADKRKSSFWTGSTNTKRFWSRLNYWRRLSSLCGLVCMKGHLRIWNHDWHCNQFWNQLIIQFCLAVDASQGTVRGCFFQVTDGMEHPAWFLSGKLYKHELHIHYSTIKNEALTLITAVLACSVYFGSNPVIVITDHSPLQFINSMANTNQKLLHWKLELQQYTLEIRHRPGGWISCLIS